MIDTAAYGLRWSPLGGDFIQSQSWAARRNLFVDIDSLRACARTGTPPPTLTDRCVLMRMRIFYICASMSFWRAAAPLLCGGCPAADHIRTLLVLFIVKGKGEADGVEG